MTLSSPILEVLGTPYPWKLESKKPTQWAASFQTRDGRKIKIAILLQRAGWYEILFGEEIETKKGVVHDLSMTGRGDAFRVVATVIEVVKEFVQSQKPEKMVFKADSSQSGRVRLYRTLAHKAAKLFGMNVEEVKKDGDINFRLRAEEPVAA